MAPCCTLERRCIPHARSEADIPLKSKASQKLVAPFKREDSLDNKHAQPARPPGLIVEEYKILVGGLSAAMIKCSVVVTVELDFQQQGSCAAGTSARGVRNKHDASRFSVAFPWTS